MNAVLVPAHNMHCNDAVLIHLLAKQKYSSMKPLMKRNKMAKSIRNFGVVFIGIGIFGLYSIYLQYNSDSIPHFFKIIVIGVFSLNLLMGILIILHKKWGLYYLLLALKVMYFGYPIGTQVSKKYSKYVKQLLQEQKEGKRAAS